MTHTGKIISVATAQSQADNTNYLNVVVEISKDGEVVDTRHLGFSLEKTADEIEAEVKKYIETYSDDQRLAEESKKVEAAAARAVETINTLTGKEIN